MPNSKVLTIIVDQKSAILFSNSISAKILPKNQKAREANFAKYFPPNLQHFAKFASRSTFVFLCTTPFEIIV
jgi:hypothetical protein